MTTELTFPRFISSEPIGEDLYESGSQKRIAKSIADHIENPHGHTLIGLDGAWGSGKSNAISIVNALLGNTYHVFIYDAWAHQEDLQRRSFLEEFTDDLVKKHIVEKEKWRDKLKDLLSKKKESIKKTIPKLSNAIVFSILVIISVPILSSIAAFATDAWLKTLITSLPIVALTIYWLWRKYKQKPMSLQEIFYIYREKNLEETTEETISEDEPSPRKFREWMWTLSSDLEASNKKVVIVFDNMDRLPPAKVQIIWTLVYTFFSSQSYPGISVIVPFDRIHIQEAFDSQKQEDFERTNHFINKTFSVVFNISPIVLTDWKKLFTNKFNDAFGTSENADFETTRKLFDLYSAAITPRKIIAFINDLVSYKLIWKEEIHLRYIALFVLNRQEILKNPVQQILNKDFLTKSQNLFIADEAVSDNMAALLYNVNLDKAIQVTLQREIQVAIRDRNTDDLKALCNNPDFITILDQISNEELEIETSVFCLAEIEMELAKASSDSTQGIWDKIIGKQLTLNIESLEFNDTHKNLISHATGSLQATLIKYLGAQFTNFANPSGSDYYHAISQLKIFLQEKSIETEFSSTVQARKLPPKDFMDFLKVAKQDVENYNVSTDNASLEALLLEEIPKNLNALSDLGNLKKSYKFPLIKEKIETLIKTDQVAIADVNKVFDIYRAVSEQTLLSAKFSDQKISDLLEQSRDNTENYIELAAMRLSKGSAFAGTGSKASVILNSTDEDLAGKIANKIQNFENYGALILKSLTFPKPLLITTLKKIFLSRKGISLNIVSVLPKFHSIVSTLGITAEQLFIELNRWQDYFKMPDGITIESIIPDTAIFEPAFNIQNDLTDELLNEANKYIQSATYAEFMEAFKDSGSYFFQLLNLLLKHNQLKDLPAEVFNAYKDTMKAIAVDEDDVYIEAMDPTVWKEIYRKSDKAHLQPTLKDIRDIFIRDKDITNELFLLFESVLREQASLDEKAGEVVRKIIGPASADAGAMQLIIDNQAYYADLFIKAGNDAFDFIDKLRLQIELDPTNASLQSLDTAISHKLAPKVTVTDGSYFSNNPKSFPVDVSKQLKELIQKEKKLHFLVNNELVSGVDPDPDTPKRLHIRYKFDNSEHEKTIEEGKWVSLP